MISGTLIPGKWTKREDNLLTEMVLKGMNWSEIAVAINEAIYHGVCVRCYRTCKRRWDTKLDPTIIKKAWSDKEDSILIETYQEVGNKWSVISHFLAGRSQEAIRQRMIMLLKVAKNDIQFDGDITKALDKILVEKRNMANNYRG